MDRSDLLSCARRPMRINRMNPDETFRGMLSLIEQLADALEASHPAGYVLVPREPTQAMLDAGYYPSVQRRGAKSTWQCMLAAAPPPPAAQSGVKVNDDLFSKLRAAYQRGAMWREENGSLELLHKASYDYADAATSALDPVPVAPVEAESVGWLFHNPDTGTEFSENHPVESGECEDAENIRSATAENLIQELLVAWKELGATENQIHVAPVEAEAVEPFAWVAEERQLFADQDEWVEHLFRDKPEGKRIRNVRPLYTAPPSVSAIRDKAFKEAAEICQKRASIINQLSGNPHTMATLDAVAAAILALADKEAGE